METLSVSKLEENYLYTGCMCGIYGFIFTLGQFTRNYTQTTKRGLLTTNKG